jgi:hypothetical protein
MGAPGHGQGADEGGVEDREGGLKPGFVPWVVLSLWHRRFVTHTATVSAVSCGAPFRLSSLLRTTDTSQTDLLRRAPAPATGEGVQARRILCVALNGSDRPGNVPHHAPRRSARLHALAPRHAGPLARRRCPPVRRLQGSDLAGDLYRRRVRNHDVQANDGGVGPVGRAVQGLRTGPGVAGRSTEGVEPKGQLLDRANDPTECLFLRLCLSGLDPNHVVALKHPSRFRQDATATTSAD